MKPTMRKVTIILTKYSDFTSSLLYLVSGFGYTHASIGLEEGEFYSFNFKGFCTESLGKFRRHGVKKSLCYELQVPESVYETLRESIQDFRRRKEEFSYTAIGVIFCFLRIPFKWKDHYFCSQFVAEMLEVSGALVLIKAPSLYLPNHFCCELERSGLVQSIEYNVV